MAEVSFVHRYMDVAYQSNAGAIVEEHTNAPVHPEHRHTCASMRP
jgi:hypothetical protein